MKRNIAILGSLGLGTGNEKVGSDSGGEGCSILFLEVEGNIGIIGKTDVGKHAILSHSPS